MDCGPDFFDKFEIPLRYSLQSQLEHVKNITQGLLPAGYSRSKSGKNSRDVAAIIALELQQWQVLALAKQVTLNCFPTVYNTHAEPKYQLSG